MSPGLSLKHLLVSLFLFVTLAASAQQSVVTQHNNISRTGWYDNERILNKKNVNANSFGKLFTRTVDDQVYAQPLVKLNLAIPGKGIKNVVFVATVNNSVYAFDADSAEVTAPYWQVNITAPGARPVAKTDMTGACGGGYNDFSGNMGIVGTPVIDTVTNTIYLVARSLNTGTNTYYQYLHALDITTGAEKAGSPVAISAVVNGTGDGSIGGKVYFDPQKNNQRPGLLLFNGTLYIGWSSHCDWGPYHGWVMGYNAATLQQQYVYCTTPDGYFGGIWMSGGGPSADENGNIYVGVGNGSVGKNGNVSDLRNRSESALKLTPDLNISSFFTPNNYETLEGADLDFGVTQVMLIPNTDRAIVGVKDGKLFLLDRNNLGGYSAGADNVVQTINLGGNAFLRSAMSYYKGASGEYVYSWSENALLKAFPYNRTTGMFDLGSTISSGIQGPTGNNGALLSVSSNGNTDSTAILWATHAATGDANQSVRPGILRAIDATDVTKELWNSGLDIDDSPGNYAKFNCPTIANGKVYLATFSNQLVVYGLKEKVIRIDSCSNTNLALHRTAYTSSVEGVDYYPANAVDGNFATRWSSEFSDPQYLTVVLDNKYDLCKVVIHWEYALGKDFKIQLSDDNSTYTDAANITNNTESDITIPITGAARFVRMYGLQRGTPYGYSIWEMEVYGKRLPASCPAPSNLYVSDVYEQSAVLHWTGSGASGYVVQYKTVTATNWTQTTTTTNELALTNLSCNTPYLFKVLAVCAAGDSTLFSTAGAFNTLPCDAGCDPLPTRWSTQDIGDVALSGAACYNSATNTFDLKGSGNGAGGTADAFRFAYQTVIGDGEVIARVLDLDNAFIENKAGIMVRESLAPGSRNVFLALTGDHAAVYQWRTATDGVTGSSFTAGVDAPYWLRLSIKGSVYTAYISIDGSTWFPLGTPVDAGFGNGLPVYVGLAVSSNNNSVLSRSHISDYSFSGVLPLQLISFTGNLTLNNEVGLHWVTTRESGTKYFIIERTTDFSHYTAIDTVYAENDGDFTENYNSIDPHPLKAMNYYRLRIVDMDGRTSYSSIVAVRFTDAKAPLLYPNPAAGFVNIAPGTEPVKETIFYDVMGRVLLRLKQSATGLLNVPVNTLSNGLYVVEIRTTNSVFKTKLVVKN